MTFNIFKNKKWRALLCGTILAANSQAFADCDPGTEVTNRLGFTGWLERTIELDPDDATRLFAIAAKHCGNIKHLNIGQNADAFNVGGTNRHKIRAYGFTNTTTDKLVFSVKVPQGQGGAYRPSLWFEDAQITPGNVFKVTGSGGAQSVLIEAEELGDLERENEITYNRPATSGYIILNAGVNEVEVSLESISSSQVSLGENASRNNASGIRIGALELIKESKEQAFIKQARTIPAEMDWISEPGRWGLFFHYSTIHTRTVANGTHTDGSSYSANELIRNDWERFVNDFDVVAFADEVEGMGASYAVMTIFHGLPYFPAPSEVLDSIYPGRTTQRDLIRELGNELESRGMRLALYFHTGKDEPAFLEAMGYNDFDDIQLYNRNIISLHEEWAKRYNGTGGYPKLLSTALYFDALWQGMVQRDFPFKQFVDAVKAPDALPDSILGLSVQRVFPPSPLADVFITDAGQSAAVRERLSFDTPDNRLDGASFGVGPGHPIRLENGWSMRDGNSGWSSISSLHGDNNLISLVAHGNGMNGPTYINLALAGDVRSNVDFFDPNSVAQMKRVSAALSDAFQQTNIIDNSQYNQVTYTGHWVPTVQTGSFLSSTQRTTEFGATMRSTFKGSSVALYMKENNRAGQFRVRIDGQDMGVINMPLRNNATSVKAFEATGLSNGSHEILITSLSDQVLDFDYISTGDDVVPTEPNSVVVGANGTVIDDVNPAIVYGGNWRSEDRVDSFDGTISYSNVAGASAEYTFSGNSLRAWTQKGRGGGIIDVYLDGQLIDTVDTYASSSQHSARFVNLRNLSDGPHTVRFECSSQSNVASKNSWCHLDRLKTHISSLQDLTTIDDQGFGEMAYSGDWEHFFSKSANGTLSRTQEAGASVQMSFTGSDMRIFGRKGRSDGIFDLYIDDEKVATIDSYRNSKAEFGVLLHRETGLSNGVHTLRLVCTGSKNSASTSNFCHLDEIEVR